MSCALFGQLVAWSKVAEVGHDVDEVDIPKGFKKAPYQPDDVNREPCSAN